MILLVGCKSGFQGKAATLDQQQLLTNGSVAFWSDLPQVQTFTPSISGKLVKVDLALNESPATFNEMVHVSIVVWNTNQPGTVLGGSDFAMDDFTGTVDFSSQNIILNAGSMCGVMLSNDLSYYGGPLDPYRNTGIDVQWGTNPYAGGSLWTGYNDATDWQERAGTDVVFATYMHFINIDIKPGGCPNLLKIKSKGALSVAILGTEDFDVTTIDADSISLIGVSPIHGSYEDVATPVSDGAGECECTTEGPDGYLDLTLKFETQEIVNALGEVNDGDILSLTLIGVLNDGIPIQGADCVVVIKRGRKKK